MDRKLLEPSELLEASVSTIVWVPWHCPWHTPTPASATLQTQLGCSTPNTTSCRHSTRPLLQDQERQLFCLILRNKNWKTKWGDRWICSRRNKIKLQGGGGGWWLGNLMKQKWVIYWQRVQRKCSKQVCTELWRRMEELSENFNRLLENIRKKSELRNKITGNKYTGGSEW